MQTTGLGQILLESWVRFHPLIISRRPTLQPSIPRRQKHHHQLQRHGQRVGTMGAWTSDFHSLRPRSWRKMTPVLVVVPTPRISPWRQPMLTRAPWNKAHRLAIHPRLLTTRSQGPRLPVTQINEQEVGKTGAMRMVRMIRGCQRDENSWGHPRWSSTRGHSTPARIKNGTRGRARFVEDHMGPNVNLVGLPSRE
jgi:hypothetical protein